VLVADQLDFDVARLFDKLFDEDAVIAEARLAFVARRLEAFAHVLFGPGQPHALAAAAGRGLHHHRIADFAGDAHRVLGVVDFTDEAGDNRHAGGLCQLLRFDLVAHRCDGLGRRADERDIFLGERAGEPFAFGQEAVARMHRLRAGLQARLHDGIAEQIRFGRRRRPEAHGFIGHFDMQRGRIGVGINRDGLDAHFARGLDDAAGDFTTVGDEDLVEHWAGSFCAPFKAAHDVRVNLSVQCAATHA
jgi:hypothetical protein